MKAVWPITLSFLLLLVQVGAGFVPALPAAEDSGSCCCCDCLKSGCCPRPAAPSGAQRSVAPIAAVSRSQAPKPARETEPNLAGEFSNRSFQITAWPEPPAPSFSASLLQRICVLQI